MVPYDQKWYPMNQGQKFTQEQIGKIGHLYKSLEKSKKKYYNTDWNFIVCQVIGDRWY